MSLPSTHLIDELATAYVQAVAAAAGSTIAVQRRDYGIDGTFRLISSDDGFYETGYPVDFQLKATSNAAETNTEVVFDLKIANYNKIVTRPANAAPYYLLLVCFSGPEEEWCKISGERLCLSAKSYWWTGNEVSASNTSTKRLRIPQQQRFSIHAISNMLNEAEARYQP